MTTGFYFDPENDHRVWVFVQGADGTLSAPVSYLADPMESHDPMSVAIGDITGDGQADVVVGVDGLGIQVFPQLADGSLGSPALTPTQDSFKIRVGQLDGDGFLDVAGIDWGTTTVGVLINDGNGGLSAPVEYPAQHGGYDDLEVADMTGDGLDDLVVMSGQTYAVPNISVVPQLAAGGFDAPAEYFVGHDILTSGIGVGDVTGDGRRIAHLGRERPRRRLGGNDVVASYGGNNSHMAVFELRRSGARRRCGSRPRRQNRRRYAPRRLGESGRLPAAGGSHPCSRRALRPSVCKPLQPAWAGGRRRQQRRLGRRGVGRLQLRPGRAAEYGRRASTAAGPATSPATSATAATTSSSSSSSSATAAASASAGAQAAVHGSARRRKDAGEGQEANPPVPLQGGNGDAQALEREDEGPSALAKAETGPQARERRQDQAHPGPRAPPLGLSRFRSGRSDAC
jgi:hypothetical protein